MYKVSASGAAFVLASSIFVVQASAADLITQPAVVAVDPIVQYIAPPADRWTGPYAGVHVGAGFVTAPASDRDFALGVQAGYNQQFGLFVLGGELEGTYTNGLQYRIGTGGILEQTWSGAAKIRGGVAIVDNVLAFGSVGLAAGYLDTKGTVTSNDMWATGLTFGGGVEVAFNDSMSGKVEYAQTRFDGVRSSIGGASRTDNLVNHAVKAGLNFRF